MIRPVGAGVATDADGRDTSHSPAPPATTRTTMKTSTAAARNWVRDRWRTGTAVGGDGVVLTVRVGASSGVVGPGRGPSPGTTAGVGTAPPRSVPQVTQNRVSGRRRVPQVGQKAGGVVIGEQRIGSRDSIWSSRDVVSRGSPVRQLTADHSHQPTR